jgi:hypothetical protein
MILMGKNVKKENKNVSTSLPNNHKQLMEHQKKGNGNETCSETELYDFMKEI